VTAFVVLAALDLAMFLVVMLAEVLAAPRHLVLEMLHVLAVLFPVRVFAGMGLVSVFHYGSYPFSRH
jgi:hypothetical protein